MTPTIQTQAPRPTVPGGVQKLREQLQKEFRERQTLEERFRSLAEAAGIRSETVVLDDAIPPAPGVPAPRREPMVEAAAGAPAEPGPFWPRRRLADPPVLHPTPGRACLAIKESGVPVTGIVALGFSREALETIVRNIATKQVTEMSFIPVFFTDSLEFEIFREHGFLFEYLPAPERRTGGSASWASYARARLEHAKAMWGIGQIIVYGGRQPTE
jgi:hypothetical protein